MENENEQGLFRKKVVDRISSPDQLTDYLRVTSAGVWVILIAIILLLAGVFVWSATGTLETTAEASVKVTDHSADVYLTDYADLSKGMPLRIESGEYTISSVEEDEFGRTVGHAAVDLPDGSYDAEVVTDSIRPIEFLLENR